MITRRPAPLLIALVVAGIVASGLWPRSPAAAASIFTPQTDLSSSYTVAPGILVADKGVQTRNAVKDFLEEWGRTLDQAATQAIISSLQMLSRTIAHETALKVAQGADGIRSLTEGRTIETIRQDAMGAAAGEFIGSFSQAFFGDASFLCNPDPNFRLFVQIGLVGTEAPKPKCDWREVQGNYRALAQQSQAEWLKRLSASFEPTQSDAGAMLLAMAKLDEYRGEVLKTNVDPLKLDAGKGLKNLLNAAGIVNQPIEATNKLIEQGLFNQVNIVDAAVWNNAIAKGAILYPFVNQFINTLASETLNRWLSGLWGVYTPCDIPREVKTSTGEGGKPRITGVGSLLCGTELSLKGGPGTGYGGSYDGGRTAQDTFASLLNPKIAIGGEYDIIAEMSACPDASARSINNCVMTTQFATAVLNQLTLAEAVERGQVDANQPLGYIQPATSLEPDYTEGYGYANIQKMRKARIVPTGWELAAQMIRLDAVNSQNANFPPVSLKQLMTAYNQSGENGICDGFRDGWENATTPLANYLIDTNDNIYCGLVDPNWVLKAPQQKCTAEVAGPLYQGGGVRQDYCAESKDCILERADGSCQMWGHCDREKNIWWFDGQSCPNYYDTCQTFVNDSFNNQISVLKSSVNYAGCSADNAGCRPYALTQDTA
ncbi:MAG: hypothetical protein AAB817_03170, partial [Patescibacteria group bacterium]